MNKLAGIILLGLALGAGAGPVLVYTNGVLPVEGSMWVENVPRPSPAVSNLWPYVADPSYPFHPDWLGVPPWPQTNDVPEATNEQYEVWAVTNSMQCVTSVIVGGEDITGLAIRGQCDTATNVTVLTDAEIIRRWAKEGKVCEVLGRHFWEDARPYSVDGNGLIVYQKKRRCEICGKIETFKPGEWE